MTFSSYNDTVLSVLIFSPLLAAAVAAFIRSERLLRWWTLAFTTAAALSSLPLYSHFDPSTAAFQFQQTVSWIPALNINYTVGIDGISLLLVLLTTLIMPLCVLASWRYIQTRVKEFMICLLHHGNRHGRRLLCPGPRPLLRLLGGHADSHGPADRRLGRTAQSLRVAQVLHLHHVRLGLPAGSHHRPLPARRHFQHRRTC